MVIVREREGAAIFHEVESHRARDVRESPIVIVGVEVVPFVSGPSPVGTNQLIDSIPPLFVTLQRYGVEGRLGYDLSPEEAGKVATLRAGDHSVGNIEVG